MLFMFINQNGTVYQDGTIYKKQMFQQMIDKYVERIKLKNYPRDDVIEGTRFLMRPLAFIPPWLKPCKIPASVAC